MDFVTKAQLACAGILPDIVTRGAADHLPALVWAIGMNGMSADVDGLCLDPAQHRAAFDGWVKVVGATARPETVDAEGVAYLCASRRFTSKDLVIVLRAAIAAGRPAG